MRLIVLMLLFALLACSRHAEPEQPSVSDQLVNAVTSQPGTVELTLPSKWAIATFLIDRLRELPTSPTNTNWR